MRQGHAPAKTFMGDAALLPLDGLGSFVLHPLGGLFGGEGFGEYFSVHWRPCISLYNSQHFIRTPLL